MDRRQVQALAGLQVTSAQAAELLELVGNAVDALFVIAVFAWINLLKGKV